MVPTWATLTAGTNFIFSWLIVISAFAGGRAPGAELSSTTTASFKGLPSRSSTKT
ncbi:MAG: hypothetical protein U1E77_11350 [Inhella sp.]